MDPNEVLERILTNARHIKDYRDETKADEIATDPTKYATEAEQLAQDVSNLDTWLTHAGPLPDRWEPLGGGITLMRKIKGDALDYKNVIWSHAGYGFYVELYWRKNDMAEPMIEPVFHDAKRGAAEAQMMSTLLRCAATEAKTWVDHAAKGEFWVTSLKRKG